MTAQQDERRRYFRVSDLIGVRYRLLSSNETELAVQAQPSSLKGVLSQMDGQIAIALASLKKYNAEIHTLLDLYNQKINLVIGHGLAGIDEVEAEPMRACQVNLSACGISFPSPDFATLNQHVEIELNLYQSSVNLRLIAAVIACEDYLDEVNKNTHLIRANFVNISDTDQELLIQYVIKRQAQQLNEQREPDN